MKLQEARQIVEQIVLKAHAAWFAQLLDTTPRSAGPRAVVIKRMSYKKDGVVRILVNGIVHQQSLDFWLQSADPTPDAELWYLHVKITESQLGEEPIEYSWPLRFYQPETATAIESFFTELFLRGTILREPTGASRQMLRDTA